MESGKTHPCKLPDRRKKLSSFTFAREYWTEDKINSEKYWLYKLYREKSGQDFYLAVGFCEKDSRSRIARWLRENRALLRRHVEAQTNGK